MDRTKLQHFENKLRELQSSIEDELRKAAGTASPLALDGSIGRVSRNDAMQLQQMALEMKRRREEQLMRVQTCLLRIQQGTYGICGRCSRPISEARLDAFPDSEYCVRCAW